MRTSYLLKEQLSHVMAALTPTNRLVVEVCIETGLRIGDVLALKSEQLGRRFTITEEKTGKKRRVSLSESLLDDIRAQSGLIYVFPGRLDENKHRTRQTVWKDVKRAQKAFRIEQNIGVHSMRKVYAVDLMRKYGDIERVRKALNHDNLAVTTIYAMADVLLQTAPKRGRKGR